MIDAKLDRSPPSLRLKFGDHDATFTPGTKNNYFQELEALPAIAAQKDAFMQKMIEQSRPKVTQRKAPPPAIND